MNRDSANPSNGSYRRQNDVNNRELPSQDAFSNDEEEDDVCCAKCNQRPEDVLILTCDHNLCLECAANNLRE